MTINNMSIKQYLCKYQNLWYYLCEKIYSDNMDVACTVLNDKNFYNCNFSGCQRIYLLFFTNCSSFFFGIPLYDRKLSTITNLDEWPIYVFDLTSSEPVTLIGNFKTFIKENLTKFIHQCKNKMIKSKPSMYKMANEALKEINTYSDVLIKQNIYELLNKN